LKQKVGTAIAGVVAVFLYIDPIKQGLKLNKISKLEQNEIEFLYIDPIKQGLKLK